MWVKPEALKGWIVGGVTRETVERGWDTEAYVQQVRGGRKDTNETKEQG